MYWFLWGVAHLLVRLLYRVSYTGGQHVPRHGPVLICANHLGWWDPIIAAIACRRRIYFMAKAELWRNPLLRVLLPLVGAFPVKRGAPDRKALARALELLADGRAVGIFPEGTRDRRGVFRRAEPGIGLLALKAGAPIVPGYFEGPYGFRKPVRLTIGEPFQVEVEAEAETTGAQKRQAVADEVMRRIAALGGRAEDYPYQGDVEVSDAGAETSGQEVAAGRE